MPAEFQPNVGSAFNFGMKAPQPIVAPKGPAAQGGGNILTNALARKQPLLPTPLKTITQNQANGAAAFGLHPTATVVPNQPIVPPKTRTANQIAAGLRLGIPAGGVGTGTGTGKGIFGGNNDGSRNHFGNNPGGAPGGTSGGTYTPGGTLNIGNLGKGMTEFTSDPNAVGAAGQTVTHLANKLPLYGQTTIIRGAARQPGTGTGGTNTSQPGDAFQYPATGNRAGGWQPGSGGKNR